MSRARFPRKTVNGELLVQRYVTARWPLARCAREQGISERRAKEVLAGLNVPVRARSPDLDADAVLAAFAKHPSVDYVRQLFRVDARRITRILDENGAERLRDHGTRPPALKNSLYPR